MTTLTTGDILLLIYDVRDVLTTGMKCMIAGVGLTQGAVSSLCPSLFPIKGASKYRPHGREPGNIHASAIMLLNFN